MPQLTDLPDKLLSEIFGRVHAKSPDTVPDLGLTCKRLQRLSHPIKWEHVVLPWMLRKNSPIARFIELHSANEHIRSLRLQPQLSVLNAFKIGMKNAFDHLETLCDCLGTFDKLTTFSIFLNDQVDSRCYFPGPVLARIVRALPPSLAHLELDTECIDRIGEDEPVSDPSDHLCLAISDCIPHLETLRIRLSCICVDLFYSLSTSAPTQATSKLRRAFIQLSTSPENERHVGLSRTVRDCKVRHNVRRDWSSVTRHGPLKMKDMCDRLLHLQASGAFPQLQHLIVYSWVSEYDPTDKYCMVQDIATRSTTRYSMQHCEWADYGRPPRIGKKTNRWDGDYMISNDGKTLYGRRTELEAALVHEVSWKETQLGVRMPPLGKSEREVTHLYEGLLPSSGLV
jgi:hypothetical protein